MWLFSSGVGKHTKGTARCEWSWDTGIVAMCHQAVEYWPLAGWRGLRRGGEEGRGGAGRGLSKKGRKGRGLPKKGQGGAGVEEGGAGRPCVPV